MSRWASRLSRKGGGASGSGGATRPSSTSATAGTGRAARAAESVPAPLVEDIDGVLLVRSVDDDSFPMAVLAEVAHTFGAEADIVTVMVGSEGAGQGKGGGHWPRLVTLLDSLRAQGTRRVRLVLSGAGDDRPGRPGTARRIADGWGFEVFAPDGVVLITPGGSLFVRGDDRPEGGWWRFAPGEAPRRLGPRAPAPAWQEAVGRVPTRTSGGCVVEQIPAGLVIRPADAPGPRPDDLCFAVPLDSAHAVVLVGAPHAEDVAADEVAAVLSALPAEHRARVRLAPGGQADLLRLAHTVADTLDSRVDVLTGLPLLADHAPPGAVPRPTLIGRDGEPSWQPYVTAVACLPTDARGRTPMPRLLGSLPPDWLPGGTEPGTVRLTDGWQATVTRSGLALWAQDTPRPPLVGPAVDPETCAIELGAPGQRLDASLLTALSRLLTGLGATARARTTLLVRGRLTGGEADLRRLAAEHGVRGIRYVTAARPAPPSWQTPSRPDPAPGPSPRPPAPVAVTPDAPRERPPAVRELTAPAPAPAPEPVRRPAAASVPTNSASPAQDSGADATPVRTPAKEADAAARDRSAPGAPGERGGERPDGTAEAGRTAVPGPRTNSRGMGPTRSASAITAPLRGSALVRALVVSPDPVPVPVPDPVLEPDSNTDPASVPTPAPDAQREQAEPPAPLAVRRETPRLVLPGHVSTAGQRAVFRELVGDGWEGHAAAVDGLLERKLALRGDEREAARLDLVAVHAYLTADEGPLCQRELARGLRAGEARSQAYAGCVASGLRRLPSYRGVALRGGAADGAEPRVGALLQDPAPVGALARIPAEGGTAVRYAIWSTTGREVGDLAADGEVVFAPGTGFRVLGTWTAPAGTSVVLLRELPAHATTYMDGARELSPRDLAALTELKDALAGGPPTEEGRSWAGRCVGPVGGSG
ncbi:hypothetical protein [Streptomyces sp. CBMA29]|uniref:hypothetical protein n=1 Tax=Streptomyces sp. CBMA29 TaxID=1896314 RepID=UPI001661920A|nr:hypothetical protein [Streptomyces sp. CBMA29]MBD0735983.1 hypothetical protein [Streptomyces sp. CBMA29]